MVRILNRELSRGEKIDHINGNGLDNRRDNIRLATHTQNMRNTKLRKNNKTGYKGVMWNTRRRKFQTYITVNSKLIYLGQFDLAEEAHKAYCDAAVKYHGEFARFE